MLTKLQKRKLEIKQKIRQALKDAGIDSKTVETRALIEVALERATMYKYQKMLMLVETIQKCEEGNYS